MAVWWYGCRSYADASCTRRWTYLEAGVDKVMTSLQEGVDMQTVRSFRFIYRFLTNKIFLVHGCLHVGTAGLYSSYKWNADRKVELSIISARHRRALIP